MNVQKAYFTIFLIVALADISCKKDNSGPNPNTPIDPGNPNSAPGQFIISLETVSSDSAKIIWTKSIDPDNDSVSYKIYLNDTLKGQNYSALHFTFKNLDGLTTYNAKVVAVDVKSKETVSNKSFTTTNNYWLKFLRKVEYGPITSYSYQRTGQMTKANDGGYIIVGNSQLGDWPDGPINAFTLKIDSLGNKIWQKRYNISSDMNKIVNCNGGYLICGKLKIAKIDNSGEIIWQISPNLPFESINGIAVSADGSIYAVGYAPGGPPNNVIVATLNKYDPNGNLVWARTFTQTARDEFHDIKIYSNNELVILGRTNDPDADFWVVSLSMNGVMNWSRTYHDGGYAFPESIMKTTEGHYVICGFSYYTSSGPYLYLQMIDATGNNRWVYNVSDNSTRGYSICETADGNLIVTGGYELTYTAQSAIYKFDKNGAKLWGKLYSEFGTYLFNKAVIPTSDGGYIINCQKAKTYNAPSERDQIYIFKTDNNGEFN
jgi:hypothetical protein